MRGGSVVGSLISSKPPWSFSNMSGAVLWNSCFRGTRSFLEPGAIGIWGCEEAAVGKSSWYCRFRYRHHTPTTVVSGEHAIDNFTKLLYQPAQCYIWFLIVSYPKDTKRWLILDWRHRYLAGSQAPSSTPYQPLGTDGHMTWWDPTWNGMGYHGTVTVARSWLKSLRNMGVPAESRQAWFLGWQLWVGIMGQLAWAWFHGALLIMLIIHSWHGKYPHDLQGFYTSSRWLFGSSYITSYKWSFFSPPISRVIKKPMIS